MDVAGYGESRTNGIENHNFNDYNKAANSKRPGYLAPPEVWDGYIV
jgi:hypothetical protein